MATAQQTIAGYQKRIRDMADDFALKYSHKPTAILMPEAEAVAIIETAKQLDPTPETAMRLAGISPNPVTGRAKFLGYEVLIGPASQGTHALLIDTDGFGPVAA